MDGSGLYDIPHPDEGVEQDNGQMYCNDGWGHLLILSLLLYGESQHPSSPHYNDQAKLHSQRQASSSGSLRRTSWPTPDPFGETLAA
jgi:hypothetical protein